MGVDGDNAGLGHKPRHSGSLSDILRYDGLLTVPDPLGEAFRKWGVPADDLEARHVATHLAKAWKGWSWEQRFLLIQAAECVAKAEKLKLKRSKTQRTPRRKRLARCAVDASKLATSIATLFPPPWENRPAAIGDIVARLVSFSVAAFRTTAGNDQALAAMVARSALERLRKALPEKNRRTLWEYIRDLAQLASRREFSERTIRRYLDERYDFPQNPTKKTWDQNLKLLVAAARLAPRKGRTADQELKRAMARL